MSANGSYTLIARYPVLTSPRDEFCQVIASLGAAILYPRCFAAYENRYVVCSTGLSGPWRPNRVNLLRPYLVIRSLSFCPLDILSLASMSTPRRTSNRLKALAQGHVCDKDTLAVGSPKALPASLLVTWGSRRLVVRRQPDYAVCY